MVNNKVNTQLDDTQLEWYGLDEKKLEEIRKEKEYSLEEVKKSLKMQWLIEDLFGIKITDTDLLLSLYNLILKNVQNNTKKKSWQIFENVK